MDWFFFFISIQLSELTNTQFCIVQEPLTHVTTFFAFPSKDNYLENTRKILTLLLLRKDDQVSMTFVVVIVWGFVCIVSRREMMKEDL